VSEEFKYNLRTVVGFLLLAAGLSGSLFLGWWLIFRGDIVETIHTLKMGLPPWAWMAMKLGLSVLCAVLLLSFFVMLAVLVFAFGRKKEKR
jgi:hypothetical protein